MSILTGYARRKNYIFTLSGWKLLSRWTSSNTVHFDDGETAEEKLSKVLYVESFDETTGTLNTYSADYNQ